MGRRRIRTDQERADLDAEHAELIRRALADSDPLAPMRSYDPTLGGDTARLRGIPAIGRGVTGAIPGTDPERAATRRTQDVTTSRRRLGLHGAVVRGATLAVLQRDFEMSDHALALRAFGPPGEEKWLTLIATIKKRAVTAITIRDAAALESAFGLTTTMLACVVVYTHPEREAAVVVRTPAEVDGTKDLAGTWAMSLFPVRYTLPHRGTSASTR